MEINLSNRHIFVAGGSRGLGSAIARRLAVDAGAAVSVGYARSEGAARQLVAELRAARPDVSVGIVPCDVQDPASVRLGLEQARAERGPIRGLVISSGVFSDLAPSRTDEETWAAVLETNLTGTQRLMREWIALLRAEKATEGAVALILTSTSGQQGGPGGNVYPITKAAQIRLMKGFAAELGPEGVRVNCLAPAWTESDMSRASLERLGRDRVAEQFALRRIGQPEDVAGPACFLMSSLADFITGETLTVDGGMGMKG